jgi:dipeptidyl aminopeptidase/acylaminoacyl peptidase
MLLILGLILSLLVFFQPKTENYPEETRQEAPKQAESPQISAEHPDSILAMSEKKYHGSDLKLGKILEDNEIYTRHSVSYKSEGLKISGIMNIPKGSGPFPVLILNHGYIDPKFYTNGQGLKREQDFFARHGYAVLHSDYRNYAQSDFDPQNEIRPRSGYVEDIINAIESVKKSDLQMLDKENIGMLGHSMGGGIALNIMVIKPDIAKAYALLAPINSDYKVNFDKWVRSDWSDTAQEFIEKYGEPQENPELWDSLSAKNYFYKVSSPVMLHQGTSDDQVPVEWSRELNEMLKKENKNITYYEYPGEGHTFINAQSLVTQRTLQFFDSNLK